MNEHDRLVDRAARDARTVLFVGGLDAGKSTLARATAAFALAQRAHRRLPRRRRRAEDRRAAGDRRTETRPRPRRPHARAALARRRPRVRRFHGAAGPRARLWWAPSRACAIGVGPKAPTCIVVDTSAMVSGIWGQLVKYYKVDMLEPDLVVGLQRGEELEPVLGVIQRFFGVELVTLPVHPGVVPTSVDQRSEQRERAMAAYFGGELQRFRVKPTVFMPIVAAVVRSARARPAARRALRRIRWLHGARLPRVRARDQGLAPDLARGRAAESA